MAYKKLFFTITFIATAFVQALCQANYKQLTRLHGLSSDNVYFSLCDQKGLMWFGTDNGVCSYDGSEFKRFTIDDGITDNEVFRIFDDSKGRIWILPYNGQLCYILNNQIYNTRNTPWLRQFTNKDFFTDMMEDGEGRLWFFKEQHRDYWILHPDLHVTSNALPGKSFFNNLFTLHQTRYLIYNTKVDKNTWVYTMATIGKQLNTAAICTTNQYCRYFFVHRDSLQIGCFVDEATQTYTLVNSKGLDFAKAVSDKTNKRSLLGRRKINDAASWYNNMLLASENGAILLKQDGNEIWQPNIFITSVSVDLEHGVWLTTKNHGVFYYPASITKPFGDIADPIYLIKKHPTIPGLLYAASNSFIYKLQNGKTEKLSLPMVAGENEPISDLIFLEKNHLLVSNGNGVYYYNGKTFQPSDGKAGTKQMLYSNDTIFFARSNNISMQPLSNLLQPYDLSNPPFKELYQGRAVCIVHYGKNQFLFGNNFGAWRIDKSGKATPVDGVYNRIHRIIPSTGGRIAYCSDIDGVYIQQEGKIYHYTNANGLIRNSITSACFDAYENLWVATPNGISCIHTSEKKVVNYHLFSGNRDEKIYDLYLYSDSSLILATGSGLFEFNTLQKPSDTKPNLLVTHIKVNGKSTALASLTALHSFENNIEISLAAISYALPQPDFFYRIKESSPEWLRISGRTLTFANLPTGNYHIEVRCKGINGLWSPTLPLHVHIKTPLYKQWWFIGLITLTSVLLLILAIYRIQKRQRKNKEIELLLSETRQKAMRAQLNPHFVFNALNSIQFLYMSQREEKAIEYLNKFSVVLRNILKHADQTYIRIDEEIENIKSYLDIEQLRLNERFTYHIEITSDIDPYACLIPSMLLQPFIENSIWHGFKGINYTGTIDIRIAPHNEQYLCITIRDNGVGFDTTTVHDPTVSKGRHLIENRIAALNKLNKLPIRVHTTSNESGTTIQFFFPIQY